MTIEEIKNTPKIVDYVVSESLMTESKEKLHKRLDEICNLAIKTLEQESKTGWIPVSERLPEDGTWNIFTDGDVISVERYKADALDHFYPRGRWFSLDEAVAWMPLPELYKKVRHKW